MHMSALRMAVHPGQRALTIGNTITPGGSMYGPTLVGSTISL